jgi:thioredoxin 2
MNDANPYKVRCPGCRAKNRVPTGKVNEKARCGKCGAALETTGLFTGRPVLVNDRDFETVVLKSPLPVLMYAWAPWCGTCQSVGPVIDDFARDAAGRVRVARLNVDTSPALANRFHIMSVPFLFIFDNGQLKESMPGGLHKQEIMMKLAPYI